MAKSRAAHNLEFQVSPFSQQSVSRSRGGLSGREG